MNRHRLLLSRIVLTLVVLGWTGAAASAVTIPDPAIDTPLAKAKGEQTAVVAGGCFWGIQAVFQHVKGVIAVKAGYSGGLARTAHYEMVGTGKTGHAESVRITFDPSQVSYGQLLKVLFAVTHDPTELNQQGPDTGTQYRAVIFYSNADQKRIAQAYINQLNRVGVFKRPIVTEVVVLGSFYDAEDYHQDYALHHPDEPYIFINDLPKVEKLRQQLPDLYVAR